MEERGQGRYGSISEFLMEDHQRLDGLLQSTAADSRLRDDAAYHQFRVGLLRHIGMEEKILLPAVQRLRGGTPLPVAAKLRLDHGAIAALLMPTPTISIMAMIRAILKGHTMIEYDRRRSRRVIRNLRSVAFCRDRTAAGRPPSRSAGRCDALSDTPAVMSVIRRAVARAGYEFKE